MLAIKGRKFRGCWWVVLEKYGENMARRKFWVSNVLSVSFCLMKFGEFAVAEKILSHC